MRFKYVALSILLVVAAINFTRTTIEIVKSSKRLDDVKGEISLLEQEKVELNKSIDYKKSDEFIEKTARNELNMAKTGESVYVISGIAGSSAKAKETGSGVLVTDKNTVTATKQSKSGYKNLVAWAKLLF